MRRISPHTFLPSSWIYHTMDLNLFIPDLFWPDTIRPEIYQNLSIPIVEKLLSKSRCTTDAPEEPEIWLCKQFNVKQQQDNWPIAAIMLHKDAPDRVNTSKEFWMRADPVHLRIEQNHIMLADNQVFEISRNEAEQLAQDLNSIIRNNNSELLVMHSSRWYLRLAQMPHIRTSTLGQVTCRNINHFLPSGNDSMMWRKLMNEIQMLLHEHPVNRARESRGELSINSLWFWGGGYPAESLQSAYSQIWSNHDFTHALAMASRTPHAGLPPSLDVWIKSEPKKTHLIVLDTLHAAAKYRDAYGWREALKAIERNWLLPIHEALKHGHINQLTLSTTNENCLQNFTLTRTDLWKFWRPQKSMSFFSKKL